MREALEEQIEKKVSNVILNNKFKNEFITEYEFAENGKLFQRLHNPATGEWKTKEGKA